MGNFFAIMVLSLIYFFSCTTSAGIIDNVKQGYINLKTQVQEKVISGKKKKDTVEISPNIDTHAKPLPEHWKTRTLIEPIFNSGLFVIETGKQHHNTVVLVHGLGSAGLRDWIDIIPALEKNFHVIAMDLPGFGK